MKALAAVSIALALWLGGKRQESVPPNARNLRSQRGLRAVERVGSAPPRPAVVDDDLMGGSSWDAGWWTDAGVASDGGSAPDGGAPKPDSGTPDAGTDAGTAHDAGATVDAGSASDAGTPAQDAGAADAGPSDAGVRQDAGVDARAPADGGTAPGAGTPAFCFCAEKVKDPKDKNDKNTGRPCLLNGIQQKHGKVLGPARPLGAGCQPVLCSASKCP